MSTVCLKERVAECAELAEASQLDETSSAIKSQESLLEAVECGSDGDLGQTDDGMSIPLLQLIQQLLRYCEIYWYCGILRVRGCLMLHVEFIDYANFFMQKQRTTPG